MMLKKFPFILFAMACAFTANAQYYYKDLLSNKQLLADMEVYRQNKIHEVSLKSFDDDGSESEGFFCEKKISRNFQKTEVFTRSDVAAASEFDSEFDKDGNLLHTNDSSTISVTDIHYSYDSRKRIGSIHSSVRLQDDDFTNELTEDHLYTYDAKGRPEQMFVVKNKRDTTEIDFGTDEKGNIIIEKNTKNGVTYYYYYDTKNRLTDIVRGNDSGGRLEPDYIFEYNSAGRITQMTAMQEGTGNYFVWKYEYDDDLRTSDRCYSIEKKIMGSVEYVYKK